MLLIYMINEEHGERDPGRLMTSENVDLKTEKLNKLTSPNLGIKKTNNFFLIQK